MNYVAPIIWRLIFAFSIVIVTDVFYLLKKIKYEEILFSIIILFVLNLIFIKYCTIRDLYGITSHGSLDKCPALIDALFVDFIIVFIEYVTLFLTRFIKNKKEKIVKKQETLKTVKKEKTEKKAPKLKTKVITKNSKNKKGKI